MSVVLAHTGLTYITAASKAKRGARIRRSLWDRFVKDIDGALAWDYTPEEFQRLGFGRNQAYRPTGIDKTAMDWVAA